MINGQVVTKAGKPLWTQSFAANGCAYRRLKQIERELGVCIIRDKRKSQLRLVGPLSQCQQTEAALFKLAEADSTSVFVIELDAQQFVRAFKGGYRAIATAIGEDKVILDIASAPGAFESSDPRPRSFLHVTFSTEEREQYQEESHQLARSATALSAGRKLRIQCTSPASTYIVPAASRIYALQGVNPGPYIQCQGDAGKCGEVVPMTELETHLTSAALEEILAVAFTTYVAHHPDKFQHCPTPNCEQIYWATKTPEHDKDKTDTRESPIFTCPACLVAVCTGCNVSHDGLTCDEQRDHASGGY